MAWIEEVVGPIQQDLSECWMEARKQMGDDLVVILASIQGGFDVGFSPRAEFINDSLALRALGPEVLGRISKRPRIVPGYIGSFWVVAMSEDNTVGCVTLCAYRTEEGRTDRV